jgi:hypothetical protein
MLVVEKVSMPTAIELNRRRGSGKDYFPQNVQFPAILGEGGYSLQTKVARLMLLSNHRKISGALR